MDVLILIVPPRDTVLSKRTGPTGVVVPDWDRVRVCERVPVCVGDWVLEGVREEV